NRWSLLILPLLWIADSLHAEPPRRLEFTRMVAHWDAYSHPEYLPFIDEAKPEIAQVGFYGAHFWSLAHTPHGKGYPANLPVRGIKEGTEGFAALNQKLHNANA